MNNVKSDANCVYALFTIYDYFLCIIEIIRNIIYEYFLEKL